MINMSLKKTFFLGLTALSLTGNAQALSSKDILAKQCRELSQTVASLVSNQDKQACSDKLAFASIKIEAAGDLILDAVLANARQELDDAVYALQYAELNSCNKYIQISHSKFEAQRIKSAL